MISIAFDDLLQFPSLKGYTERSLLLPSMDSKVLECCYQLGMDITKGYEYIPSKMRTLRDTIVTGYRVSGEIRLDWRTSPLCTLTERIIISTKQDVSLTKELCNLMNSSLDYRSFTENEDCNDGYEYEEGFEDDMHSVSEELQVLQEMLDNVRGSSMGASGSMKTYEEYQTGFYERGSL